MSHGLKALRLIPAIAIWISAFAANAPAALAGQASPVDKLKNLEFREIGPATMGGRIDDFAVVENNPSIVYAGVASGGVWKTTNNGTSWEPVFDRGRVPTPGAIARGRSNRSFVGRGTGKRNNGQAWRWAGGV